MAKSAQKTKRAREEAKNRVLSARKAARTRLANKKEAEAIKKRDAMIEQYMPYAVSIANRVAKSLSSSVDYDDVLCNAKVGLLEAARRFDENQNVDFHTFAYYRIKGAIYDGLRKSGWLPRSIYSRIKFEEASNDYLQYMSESNREAIDSSKAATDTVNTLASIYIISLDANEDLEVEDINQVDIEKRAEFHQIRAHMKDALSSLPQKEKQLIMMYYFQNKTLEESGDKLGLSKSWVSRLHARALEMLFKRIRALAAKGNVSETEEDAVEASRS